MLIYIIPCIILLVVALFLKKREQANKDDAHTEKKTKKVKEKASKTKKETVAAEKTAVPDQDAPQISKKQQESHSVTFAQIQDLIHANNFSLAEAKINQELNNNPEQHQLYLLLAQVYRKQDDEIATKQLIGHLKQLKLFDIIENIEHEFAADQLQKKQDAEKKVALAASTATVAATELTHETVENTITSAPKETPEQHTAQVSHETKSDTQHHKSLVENTPSTEVPALSYEQVQKPQDTATKPSNQTDKADDLGLLDFYGTEPDHEKANSTHHNADHQTQTDTPDQALVLEPDVSKDQIDEVQQDQFELKDLDFTFDHSNEINHAPTQNPASDLEFNFSEKQPTNNDAATDLTSARHLDFVLEPEDQISDTKNDSLLNTEETSDQSLHYSTQTTSLATPQSIELDTDPVSDGTSSITLEKPEEYATNTPLEFTFTAQEPEAGNLTTQQQHHIVAETSPTVTATKADVLLDQFDELIQLDEAQLNLDLAAEYITIGEYERAKQLLSVPDVEFSVSQKLKVDQLLNKMAS
ncbi:hypothetical protein [Acinetobacter rathckeae]|uniref:hypothetical protein n=1 Tax=Acinetobacter rathckeae TaxID=2605272 RepID=UPI0018A31866|nr:hypothetical protein [Acinetobacter rathckeae]MBF7688458.1 hypothetical protein [Acinetobacter rathckeae]